MGDHKPAQHKKEINTETGAAEPSQTYAVKPVQQQNTKSGNAS
jgi:hypothetical protein